MPFSLEIKTDSWVNDDQSWCATQEGRDVCRSITVDISLFTVDHYVNGFIPSGTVLAIKTATGFYGPYTPGDATGLQNAKGHLYTPVVVKDSKGNTYSKTSGALYWGPGIVTKSKLPDFLNTANLKGELDATAEGAAVLGNFIRYEP